MHVRWVGHWVGGVHGGGRYCGKLRKDKSTLPSPTPTSTSEVSAPHPARSRPPPKNGSATSKGGESFRWGEVRDQYHFSARATGVTKRAARPQVVQTKRPPQLPRGRGFENPRRNGKPCVAVPCVRPSSVRDELGRERAGGLPPSVILSWGMGGGWLAVFPFEPSDPRQGTPATCRRKGKRREAELRVQPLDGRTVCGRPPLASRFDLRKEGRRAEPPAQPRTNRAPTPPPTFAGRSTDDSRPCLLTSS